MKIKYLQNVNQNSLPKNIKIEFEKVVKHYTIIDVGFFLIDFESQYPIHKLTYNNLMELCDKNELITELHSTLTGDNGHEYLDLGFEKYYYNDNIHYLFYKFKRAEYLSWYLEFSYQRAFHESYNEIIQFDSLFENSKEQQLVDWAMSIVYKRCDESLNKISSIYYDQYDNPQILSQYNCMQFGAQEGRFIKAWDIILTNPSIFEKAFSNLIDNKNEPHFYCKIGALFAQGLITKEKGYYNYIYKYNNEAFEDVSKLSKYIQKDILKTSKSVRQYISDSLSPLNKGKHNIYNSKTMMRNIIEYCNNKNIKISLEFIRHYEHLIKSLH